MESIKVCCATALLLCLFQPSFSQTINFNNLKKEDKHIATVYAGLEYGLVYGVGYGYKLKTKTPIVLNVDFSIPSGENLLDDFKSKIGGQIQLCKFKNFHFIGKAYGIYRRNENRFVSLQNFGSEFAANIGYYKRKWFTAIEFGFDKAIVTRFKHSESYKMIHPGVQDGWYEPATGGNFNFGLQAGYSIKRFDLYLKGGKLATQDFSNPTLPFYAQLGFTIRY